VTNDAPAVMYQAYRHFNQKLFGGKLPEPRIRIGGLFDGEAIAEYHHGSPGGEIRFNGATFGGGAERDMQTLVHEMGHAMWAPYADVEAGHPQAWRDGMRSVGLDPGEGPHHRKVPGGPFDLAYQEFIAAQAAVASGKAPTSPSYAARTGKRSTAASFAVLLLVIFGLAVLASMASTPGGGDRASAGRRPVKTLPNEWR
jgi:hypothetical protein